ncbi:hypothetical protein PanWU01x14_012210 [Parasponia andersonii]|uniref:CBS domain containing protein n=1 Tax=Parasponia andersonii TaxID=3476 RepID=A0A2P5E1R5_PARAD|nr:hypothetical protein PanWU01x14_012210 [Parasponia andersonii]
MDTDKRGTEEDNLRLRGNLVPGMYAPFTNKKTDTLKQVMENMGQTRSNFSFLVDDSQKAIGVITFRDIINGSVCSSLYRLEHPWRWVF